MKFRSEPTPQVNIPDLEVKVTTMDILRRVFSEAENILKAELGQRERELRPGVRELTKAYEHLETAGFYILKSIDGYKYDVMNELVKDNEASQELFDKTSK